MSISTLLTLDQLNELSDVQFCHLFHNVIECWPQAADAIVAATARPFATIAAVTDAFLQYIDALPDTDRIQILRLHPDLAGRLAAAGELTAESTAEQRQAGLTQLTVAEASELRRLNDEYRDRFGFPFVICVRQTNRYEAIVAGLRRRLQNTVEEEISAGTAEVRQICRLRVESLLMEQ